MGVKENNIHKRQKFPTDIQTLWDLWFAKNADMLNGAPAELPPLREINHRIPLIDENLKYHYQLPHCPEAMKLQLMENIQMQGGGDPEQCRKLHLYYASPKKQGSSERL
jgi:hypothetical protein